MFMATSLYLTRDYTSNKLWLWGS